MANDDERLRRAIACLPPIAPDIDRETRVQKRCHAAIAQRVLRRPPARRAAGMRLVDVVAAIALFVYLAAILTHAARLTRSF